MDNYIITLGTYLILMLFFKIYLTHGQLYNNLGNIFNSDALFQNLCCRGF